MKHLFRWQADVPAGEMGPAFARAKRKFDLSNRIHEVVIADKDAHRVYEASGWIFPLSDFEVQRVH
ncbi:MAG: hypothetical protein WKF95_00095 [Rubrobacter sp.]